LTELELTRVPDDRRLYRLDGIGTVRLEGWFGRSGSAEVDGRRWRFCRRGLWRRLIQATDISGALASEFAPRDIRRGGALRWGTRELELKPLGMRERYALVENERDLAHFDAKGWGKRPVKVTLTADRDEIQAELLLFAAFIVHQLASDANTAASTGATVASTGSYGVLLLATALLATAGAAQPRVADAAPSRKAVCSASHLSATLPAEKLPGAVAATRRRIAAAAVACDFAKLEQMGKEHPGFSFTFGGERSAAAVWRAAETRGAKPLATLVKILALPVTRTAAGAYAWPSAYTAHPKPSDWDALVRAGVVTGAEASKAQKRDNVYYGYRTAITRSGNWQFFIAGD
jgi:hypothetical protein